MPISRQSPVVQHVLSADGTQITYTMLGTGPGLVVVPGSLGSAPDYMRLARALASEFTVYVVNRRGHEDSGPIGADHNMAVECQDLTAVLKHTKARLLFGHSIGGLISLQTALAVPLDKLAVYEPPLSVDGSIPTGWLPTMQQALAAQKYARSMAIIMKGLQLSSDAGKLPTSLLTAMLTVLLQLRKDEDGKPWKRHIVDLLPTMPSDIRLVQELDSQQERFRTLTVSTLLLGGAKSASHFQLAVQTLADVLPQAQHVSMPQLEHNAPNHDAPEAVAKALSNFFA